MAVSLIHLGRIVHSMKAFPFSLAFGEKEARKAVLLEARL